MNAVTTPIKVNLPKNDGKVPELPEQKEAPTQVVAPVIEEKIFRKYKSSLENQRIIMKTGKVILITKFQYITDKKAEIEFLDEEIEAGFPYLQKAADITSSDLDPMISLKKKIIEDYLADQKAIKAGEKPAVAQQDMGASVTQKLSPASSELLSQLSAGSSSAEA